VKGLDLVIALGVVDRREEGFDLAIQAQAYHLTQHPGVGGAATKGALVSNWCTSGRPSCVQAVSKWVRAVAVPLSRCCVRQTA
jgi:hypothetical protein